MRLPRLVLLIPLLALAGCVTPTQPDNYQDRFTVSWLSDNQFQVDRSSWSLFDGDNMADLALLRIDADPVVDKAEADKIGIALFVPGAQILAGHGVCPDLQDAFSGHGGEGIFQHLVDDFPKASVVDVNGRQIIVDIFTELDGCGGVVKHGDADVNHGPQ